jgi:hypothetical protein
MVTVTKAAAANALLRAAIPRRGWTRKEFASRWSLSEGHLRKLRKKGRGPKEIDLDGVAIIPLEAEEEWAAERMAEAEAQKKIA